MTENDAPYEIKTRKITSQISEKAYREICDLTEGPSDFTSVSDFVNYAVTAELYRRKKSGTSGDPEDADPEDLDNAALLELLSKPGMLKRLQEIFEMDGVCERRPAYQAAA